MSYDTKSLIASCVLIVSILFLGGWIYERALTRTPDYLIGLH